MTNDASFTGRIPAYISNAASKLLLQLRQPALLEQFAIIIVAGLTALWCAPRINTAFKRLALRAQSRAWALAAARVTGSLALPVVWLAILWAALLIGTATGFSLDILRAAISLLIAWIVIRIVSQLVGNETWSRLVAVIAWSIAALSILNLLAPIQDQLQHSAVSFGKFQISALTMVRALFVLAVLLWLTTVLSNFAERRISTAKSLTPSLRILFIQLLKLTLPALAVVAALAVVGVDLTALAVFSGAIGIGLGLGLQQSVSNLVAGLTLLLGKSIKPGDVVAYNNTYGWVTSMGARFVALRTRDGIEYLIPNNYFVTNGVTNWTHSDNTIRLHVPFGVAYGSDLHKTIELALQAAHSVKRVLDKPEPVCLVLGMGDSAIDMDLRVWISDPHNGVANAKSQIYLALNDVLAAAGIVIPFPQRDVHIIAPPAQPQPPPAA